MSEVIRLYRSGPPMPRRKTYLMGKRETRAQKAIRRIAAEKAAYERRQSQPVQPEVKPVATPPSNPPMPAEKKAQLDALLTSWEAEREMA